MDSDPVLLAHPSVHPGHGMTNLVPLTSKRSYSPRRSSPSRRAYQTHHHSHSSLVSRDVPPSFGKQLLGVALLFSLFFHTVDATTSRIITDVANQRLRSVIQTLTKGPTETVTDSDSNVGKLTAIRDSLLADAQGGGGSSSLARDEKYFVPLLQTATNDKGSDPHGAAATTSSGTSARPDYVTGTETLKTDTGFDVWPNPPAKSESLWSDEKPLEQSPYGAALNSVGPPEHLLRPSFLPPPEDDYHDMYKSGPMTEIMKQFGAIPEPAPNSHEAQVDAYAALSDDELFLRKMRSPRVMLPMMLLFAEAISSDKVSDMEDVLYNDWDQKMGEIVEAWQERNEAKKAAEEAGEDTFDCPVEKWLHEQKVDHDQTAISSGGRIARHLSTTLGDQFPHIPFLPNSRGGINKPSPSKAADPDMPKKPEVTQEAVDAIDLDALMANRHVEEDKWEEMKAAREAKARENLREMEESYQRNFGIAPPRMTTIAGKGSPFHRTAVQSPGKKNHFTNVHVPGAARQYQRAATTTQSPDRPNSLKAVLLRNFPPSIWDVINFFLGIITGLLAQYIPGLRFASNFEEALQIAMVCLMGVVDAVIEAFWALLQIIGEFTNVSPPSPDELRAREESWWRRAWNSTKEWVDDLATTVAAGLGLSEALEKIKGYARAFNVERLLDLCVTLMAFAVNVVVLIVRALDTCGFSNLLLATIITIVLTVFPAGWVVIVIKVILALRLIYFAWQQATDAYRAFRDRLLFLAGRNIGRLYITFVSIIGMIKPAFVKDPAKDQATQSVTQNALKTQLAVVNKYGKSMSTVVPKYDLYEADFVSVETGSRAVFLIKSTIASAITRQDENVEHVCILWGIEAPEDGQANHEESKAELQKILEDAGGELYVNLLGLDLFGRWKCDVFVGEGLVFVNEEMGRRGWALIGKTEFRSNIRNPINDAIEAEIGMHPTRIDHPADYRRENRLNPELTPENILENIWLRISDFSLLEVLGLRGLFPTQEFGVWIMDLVFNEGTFFPEDEAPTHPDADCSSDVRCREVMSLSCYHNQPVAELVGQVLNGVVDDDAARRYSVYPEFDQMDDDEFCGVYMRTVAGATYGVVRSLDANGAATWARSNVGDGYLGIPLCAASSSGSTFVSVDVFNFDRRQVSSFSLYTRPSWAPIASSTVSIEYNSGFTGEPKLSWEAATSNAKEDAYWVNMDVEPVRPISYAVYRTTEDPGNWDICQWLEQGFWMGTTEELSIVVDYDAIPGTTYYYGVLPVSSHGAYGLPGTIVTQRAGVTGRQAAGSSAVIFVGGGLGMVALRRKKNPKTNLKKAANGSKVSRKSVNLENSAPGGASGVADKLVGTATKPKRTGESSHGSRKSRQSRDSGGSGGSRRSRRSGGSRRSLGSSKHGVPARVSKGSRGSRGSRGSKGLKVKKHGSSRRAGKSPSAGSRRAPRLEDPEVKN